MFDYTNLCEVNFKTRRTTYCSNIVLYSMNMFYTLYSVYNMYVQFMLIFKNFKNEDKYLYIVQSNSPRYKRLFVSLRISHDFCLVCSLLHAIAYTNFPISSFIIAIR